MTTQRQESVGRELQEEIARILRVDIDDPLIGFVTITGVDMSPDLRHALVYYSVLGDEEQKRESGRGIRRAAKYIRGLIAERMELRYTPTLRFELDETAEKAQRIEELLRQEAEELDLDDEGEEPDSDAT
ncbi:MAG: 30S ribosome-binding factor RbfA, partial [Armatimonadia bacterium]|nr:30S ribosome-binding factor RbfA [Armatimonadia bacterium]